MVHELYQYILSLFLILILINPKEQNFGLPHLSFPQMLPFPLESVANNEQTVIRVLPSYQMGTNECSEIEILCFLSKSSINRP